MHSAPLLSFILALKGDIHEVPAACFLVFARQQFYSFSLLATSLSCFKTCQKETQTLEQRRVNIAFLIHINLHLGISFHFFP